MGVVKNEEGARGEEEEGLNHLVTNCIMENNRLYISVICLAGDTLLIMTKAKNLSCMLGECENTTQVGVMITPHNGLEHPF